MYNIKNNGANIRKNPEKKKEKAVFSKKNY
jgi:hypothetical protein